MSSFPNTPYHSSDLRTLIGVSHKNMLQEYLVKLFAAQLMMAVAHCHSCGILHRDIKPENVVIQKSGYALLADFGISDYCNHNGTLCSYRKSGTKGYMVRCL